ncbi:MAG: S-layer homology domain-containing protein [Firmicutes bacterium]|nr:S-layer homology domain-containing protein [Bacillota bacterium]
MLYGLLDINVEEQEALSLLDDGQLGLLVKLGVCAEDCDLSKKITRAETAKMIAVLNDVTENMYSSYTQEFDDVGKDSLYYKYIAACCSMGYMTDYKGEFYPDASVSVEEFIKILMDMAGYKEYAEASGGTYEAYLNILKDSTDVMYLDGDKDITYNEAIYYTYKVLHIHPMYQIGYGTYKKFEQDKDSTVIEKLRDILHGEGQVEGTENTTITHPDSSIGENQVVINDEKYICAGAQDLLGYYVDFYYNKRNEIIYIAKNQKYNSSLTIESENLESYSNNTLYYRDGNDAKKKISFAERPDLIYNGIAYPSYENEDVIPQSGRIEVIDNDKDGKYDMIKVYAYEYIVAGDVDFENMIVYDKYDKALSLSLDNSGQTATILKKGKKVSFANIVENNLLAVRKSKNTNGIMSIITEISGNCADGTLKGWNDDTIKIDSKSYHVEGRLELLKKDGSFNVGVGKHIYVYLFENKAVMASYQTDNEASLGFLMKTKYNEDNEELSLKIFTSSKKEIMLVCADKLKVDGIKYKDPQNAIDALKEGHSAINLPDVNSEIAQPILYRVNSDGKIYQIDTAKQTSVEDKKSLYMKTEYNNTKWRYSLPNKTFYDSVENHIVTTVKPDTVTFFIPQNDIENSTYYNVVSSGNLLADNAKYVVRAFGDSDNFTSDYLFVYNNVPSNVPQSAAPNPVKKVRTEVNSYGDTDTYIDVFVNGTLRSIRVEENVVMPDLKEGDLIRYRTNNRTGDIMTVSKVFDISAPMPDPGMRIVQENSESNNKSDDYDNTFRMICGTLYAKDSNVITVTTGFSSDNGGIESGNYIDNFYLGSQTIYIYNPNISKNKVSVGNLYDLMSYKSVGNNASRVVIYVNNGTLKMIYKIMEED